MKKILAIILSMLLLGCSAFAVDFTNLLDVQNYVLTHTAHDMGPYPPVASIMGTIVSIDFVTGNHYTMTLEVNDDRARTALGYDLPMLTASFRLHVDNMPFEVGQQALVVGSINPMYSTPLIPNLLVTEINGYDQDEF